MDGVKLIFLGTGGGRFATITQKRRTGGFRLISKKLNIHIDPGPGALIYSIEAGLNPQKIKTVLVSHRHPDHYSNAEILVEAMTRGMTTTFITLSFIPIRGYNPNIHIIPIKSGIDAKIEYLRLLKLINIKRNIVFFIVFERENFFTV